MIEGLGEVRTKYFVEGDDLTLIYSLKAYCDPLLKDDDRFGELVIDEDSIFRIFFNRM